MIAEKKNKKRQWKVVQILNTPNATTRNMLLDMGEQKEKAQQNLKPRW